MRIDKSTAKYEAWLGERLPLIAADLNRKHALMREGPFPFLRATFYRWSQTWPEVCAAEMQAPSVLAVGDLHVENFGTWRDIEGRLVWGINDFDEVAWMPYTIDLVRLTTSAYLAVAADHLTVSPALASKAILTGYRDGLRAGGRAFVLAEHHPKLREMAVERLKEPERYWEKLNSLPALKERPPSSALKALAKMEAARDLKPRMVHRVAGLGSLGRRRYVALAQWEGGSTAREAKELTTSAWLWAHPRRGKGAILYQEVLDRAVRCCDPFVKLRGRWLVRRLAPDCSRIELASLPAKHDAAKLLHSMGFEVANVHLGAREARVLLEDLKKRKPGWLHSAAQAMVKSVIGDWQDWRNL